MWTRIMFQTNFDIPLIVVLFNTTNSTWVIIQYVEFQLTIIIKGVHCQNVNVDDIKCL
jgi:hypothetical protein